MRTLIVLALLALPTEADACPVGSDCTKYKKSQPQPKQYKRASAGAVPTFSEARVAKFLGASVWQPVPATGPKLRFIDPAKPVLKAKTGERLVTLGRLAKRDAMTLVEVDGVVHVLAACKGSKTAACLTPRPDVPFDPPNESDQERAKREEREQLVRQQRALK